jgi:hypothetical protein
MANQEDTLGLILFKSVYTVMSGVSRASDLIKIIALHATTGRGLYKNY